MDQSDRPGAEPRAPGALHAQDLQRHWPLHTASRLRLLGAGQLLLQLLLLLLAVLVAGPGLPAYEVFIDSGDGPWDELQDRARWAEVADRLDGFMVNGAAFSGMARSDIAAILRLPSAHQAIAEFGLGKSVPASDVAGFRWGNVAMAEVAGIACPWIFGWDERNPDSVLSAAQCRLIRAQQPGRKLLTNSRSWPRTKDTIIPLLQQGLLDGFVEEFQAGYGMSFFSHDVAAAARWAVENHKLFAMLVPPQDAPEGKDAHDYVAGIRELAVAMRNALGPGMAATDALWFVVADYAYHHSKVPFLGDQRSATGYGNSLVGAAGWLLDHRAILAAAKGGGLLGHYFNNPHFSGTPLLRSDATVDFSWGSAKPAATIAKDDFSVRWTGVLEAATSQECTLAIRAAGEARVWCDRRLVIDTFGAKKAAGGEATVALRAGIPADLVIDYCKRSGSAAVHLSWSGAGGQGAIIATGDLTPGELPAPPLDAPAGR